MFGIGFQELILILIVALIVVGPGRLPELAKMLGRAVAEFRRASEEIFQGLEEEGTIRELKQELKSSLKVAEVNQVESTRPGREDRSTNASSDQEKSRSGETTSEKRDL